MCLFASRHASINGRYCAPRTQQTDTIQSFADRLHVEADFLQTFVVKNFATVENVRRLHHQAVDAFVVEFLVE